MKESNMYDIKKSIIINSRVRTLTYVGFVKTTGHVNLNKQGCIYLPSMVNGKKIGYTCWV
jgi:hypothetical protein